MFDIDFLWEKIFKNFTKYLSYLFFQIYKYIFS